jgi:hypothetical protein
MKTTRTTLALLLLLSAFAASAARDPVAELPTFLVAVSSPITTFPFRVIDAEFSSQLNAVVAVSESPNRLNLYRPEDGTFTTVDLGAVPRCVSVSPDGKFAAVGHTNLITYVNLETAVVVKTLNVDTDVLDIVLAGNGFVYAFPRVDQWANIHCVNIATNAETLHTGNSIYAGTVGRLHPGGLAIYGANNYLSPSDIEKYSITGGNATYQYDSPYHGDYPMCGNLWITSDGLKIITACGTVLRSSSDPALDMRYMGSLSEDGSIRWVGHSAAAGSIAVIPKYLNVWWDSSPQLDQEIRYYTTDFNIFRGKALLPSFVTESGNWQARGRWVFFNAAGTKQYVVVQADEASGMLYDYGALTIDCTNASVTPSPATINTGASSSNQQVTVTGTPGCGWKATGNQPWLNSLSTGVSDGFAAITVGTNSGVAARTGTVTIGNATVTVNQAGIIPGAVSAKAGSASSVSLTWTSPAADHFEVWRSSGAGFTLVGTPAVTSFTDSTVSASSGYIYKVRAVASGGATSEFGAPDYAHTYTFTDPVLSGMPIRAAHLTELRAAVNAMRTAAGLGAATFTDPSLVGVTAARVHITELRDAVNGLRTSLALAPLTFSTLPANSTILAQTTQDLRTAAE